MHLSVQVFKRGKERCTLKDVYTNIVLQHSKIVKHIKESITPFVTSISNQVLCVCAQPYIYIHTYMSVWKTERDVVDINMEILMQQNID